ncbi:Metal transporter CNNM4 [Orchesella cincta]|uniref:Metal transporter CNNM4 n=1 Tax=Orchesella cincta TaxID=48709 RepID=A0A1D2MAD7_ORCCI|nr:Metal transporter CNNM4 [Orchesella cincta]
MLSIHFIFQVLIENDENSVGVVEVKLPYAGEMADLYLCLRTSQSSWKRQGESNPENFGLPIKPRFIIKLTTSLFPLYVHILLLILFLTLSGLFSGLNLGLMTLDKTELKIIMSTGSPLEKKYASKIAPVRDHGNFLLCSLLFSNVLVNATLTIFVDDLTSGLVAIAGSTLSIVIFGEIIPQALCSRYGLAVGAKTILITKFFMALTSPLAFPLSILLDKLLGEEIGNIYNRDRLKELLKVTKDHHGLENEEVGIISGALGLKSKTVKDVMIKLSKIFMLPTDTVLDFDTMAEIEHQGYSRIPVFDGERSNVVALINVRQLTMLDADDRIPLRAVSNFYNAHLFFVFENTRLDFMFKAFREGSRGHMAFVQRVNDDSSGDPIYETIGMLTMEDVLEEILQTQILDENDVEKCNARSGKTKRSPSAPIIDRKVEKVVEIPATLAFVSTQFLTTSVEPFKNGTISVVNIQRLLKTNVEFIKLSKRSDGQSPNELYLYEQGKAANAFTMILEGRVQVTVGKEKFTYEAGPFSVFGVDFLLNDQLRGGMREPVLSNADKWPDIFEMTELRQTPAFIPDYSVKVLSDVFFFRLEYNQYQRAVAATEGMANFEGFEKADVESKAPCYEIDKVFNGDGVNKEESNKMTDSEVDESKNPNDMERCINNCREETKLLQKPNGYS